MIKTMEKIIKELADKICKDLTHDLYANNQLVFKLVLNAFNRYQEDERDGVGYLFNINEWEDVKCCIEGGMTLNEFHALFEEIMSDNRTPYFLFNHYDHTELFKSMKCVVDYMINSLESVVLCMLTYHACDEYKALYNHSISDYILTNNML